MYSLHVRFTEMFCSVCGTPLEGWNYPEAIEIGCPKNCNCQITSEELEELRIAFIEGQAVTISMARTWLGMVWLNIRGCFVQPNAGPTLVGSQPGERSE